jgi:hypothetical protein
MKQPLNKKSGEAISLILFAVFSVTVLGAILFKGRNDGMSMYPERTHPYQGKLIIGTNDVPAPRWK